MAFIDACTRSVLPKETFRIRFVIIMQVLTSDSAYMSEHIVSRLASLYVTCTGMNTTIGGASTTSASSAQGTVFEAAVNASGEQLSESVREELERVRGHRDNLRLLVTTQNCQRSLRGLLGQEKDLRNALDREEAALSAVYQATEQPFEMLAEKVQSELAAANATRAMDGVVNGLIELLEGKFNGKMAD